MRFLYVLNKLDYDNYLLQCYEKAKQFIFHPDSLEYFKEFYQVCHQYKAHGLLPLYSTLSLVNNVQLFEYKILVTIRLYFLFRSVGLKVHYLLKQLEVYLQKLILGGYKVHFRSINYLVFVLLTEALIEGSKEKYSYYKDLLNRFLLFSNDLLFQKRIQLIEKVKDGINEEIQQILIEEDLLNDQFLLLYLKEFLDLRSKDWFLRLSKKYQILFNDNSQSNKNDDKDKNYVQRKFIFLDQIFSFHRLFLIKLISSDVIQDLQRHYQEVTNLMLEIRRLRQYQQRQITDALHLLQSLQPPHHFKTDHLQLFYRIIPASEVGGDFFDYYYDSENRLFHFILIDVCGHGLQAAIFVTTLKSHFHYYIKKRKSPSDLLQILSSSIQLIGNQTIFVCFHYGIYDEKRKVLELWGGGLPEIIYFSPKKQEYQTLMLTGIPLGLPFPIDNDHISLSPESEDMILLLSDGVIEQEDTKGSQINLSSIIDFLRTKRIITPYDAVSVIPQYLLMKTQTPSFRDDLSIVAIQFL